MKKFHCLTESSLQAVWRSEQVTGYSLDSSLS